MPKSYELVMKVTARAPALESDLNARTPEETTEHLADIAEAAREMLAAAMEPEAQIEVKVWVEEVGA